MGQVCNKKWVVRLRQALTQFILSPLARGFAKVRLILAVLGWEYFQNACH